MAMTVKRPPRNCFQKYCGWLTSPSQRMRDMPESRIAAGRDAAVRPRSRAMKTMVSTTAATMHTVFRTSVPMTDRTPPR